MTIRPRNADHVMGFRTTLSRIFSMVLHPNFTPSFWVLLYSIMVNAIGFKKIRFTGAARNNIAMNSGCDFEYRAAKMGSPSEKSFD